MTAPVFAANETLTYHTDEAGLARFAEVHDDTTPTPMAARRRFERKDPKLIWPVMIFWALLASSGGLVLVIGRWAGVW